MTAYEIAFQGEILMEMGAGVLADLTRYSRKHPETEVFLLPMERLLWAAKQDILGGEV